MFANKRSVRIGFVVSVLSIGIAVGELSAASFDCQMSKFCWTHQYEQPAGCSKMNRNLTIETNRRFANFDEGNGTIRFKRVRPYFTPLNWFQLPSEERGVLNLLLDDTLAKQDFRLEQMLRGEVNSPVWRIDGNCDRKEI